jgi:hypothetical protein
LEIRPDLELECIKLKFVATLGQSLQNTYVWKQLIDSWRQNIELIIAESTARILILRDAIQTFRREFRFFITVIDRLERGLLEVGFGVEVFDEMGHTVSIPAQLHNHLEFVDIGSETIEKKLLIDACFTQNDFRHYALGLALPQNDDKFSLVSTFQRINGQFDKLGYANVELDDVDVFVIAVQIEADVGSSPLVDRLITVSVAYQISNPP